MGGDLHPFLLLLGAAASRGSPAGRVLIGWQYATTAQSHLDESAISDRIPSTVDKGRFRRWRTRVGYLSFQYALSSGSMGLQLTCWWRVTCDSSDTLSHPSLHPSILPTTDNNPFFMLADLVGGVTDRYRRLALSTKTSAHTASGRLGSSTK